jgi:hypothetical protein
MKVFLGKRKQKGSSPPKDNQLPVAFDMSVPNTPVFTGFSYTPEEGIEMSKHGSYSEIPGLELNQK